VNEDYYKILMRFMKRSALCSSSQHRPRFDLIDLPVPVQHVPVDLILILCTVRILKMQHNYTTTTTTVVSSSLKHVSAAAAYEAYSLRALTELPHKLWYRTAQPVQLIE